jgi:hypothetical protein
MLWVAAPCDEGIKARSAVGCPVARSITLARLLTLAFCFVISIPGPATDNSYMKKYGIC